MRLGHWKRSRRSLYYRLANAPTPFGWVVLTLCASACVGFAIGIATR